MFRLIRNLIAPYRWTLAIVFIAMLVETAMSLAGPWPLKIVLDNVVGSHHLPGWLDGLEKRVAGGAGKMQIAAIAAMGFVAIAAISGVASYVDNYYTESVGQWAAHDLRLRAYHHLQRLSLRDYEDHQIGIILSTLTTDIATIRSFASSSTLGMFVDLFTIIGMLGLRRRGGTGSGIGARGQGVWHADARGEAPSGGEMGDRSVRPQGPSGKIAALGCRDQHYGPPAWRWCCGAEPDLF